MKREMDEFKKYVREIRNTMPTYNHKRRVVVYDEYSKAGKAILEKASHYDGYFLNQIYDNPSKTKQAIYDECFDMYANDEKSDSFSICSHNGFMFTVSWINKLGVIYITRDTEYLVICNE